jgi:hypothetical protein
MFKFFKKEFIFIEKLIMNKNFYVKSFYYKIFPNISINYVASTFCKRNIVDIVPVNDN